MRIELTIRDDDANPPIVADMRYDRIATGFYVSTTSARLVWPTPQAVIDALASLASALRAAEVPR